MNRLRGEWPCVPFGASLAPAGEIGREVALSELVLHENQTLSAVHYQPEIRSASHMRVVHAPTHASVFASAPSQFPPQSCR